MVFDAEKKKLSTQYDVRKKGTWYKDNKEKQEEFSKKYPIEDAVIRQIVEKL